jgi:hypothetical protein
MPAKPRWLLHIPAILDRLASLEVPVLDRASIEELFGVRRRQAVHLLNAFGGYQLGRTFAVDRLALMKRLEKVQDDPDFRREASRRLRLSETLSDLREHASAVRVPLPVNRSALFEERTGLPEGVAIEGTRLTVEFRSAEDLLGRLYELARLAASDLELFRSTLNDSI